MRRASRIVAAIALFAAVVAAVSIFLPWHRVHRVHIEGAFCWAPDCHGEAWTETNAAVCTGTTHVDPVVFLPLALLAALTARLAFRPSGRLRWLAALGAFAAALATAFLWLAGTIVAHLFDRTEPLPGQDAFFSAVIGMLVAGLALFVLETVTAVAARRARRRAQQEARSGPPAAGSR